VNVVFVCRQNPWRLDGGALIRNYWMIRALAREHRVHLVTAGGGEAAPADFAVACASITQFPQAGGAAGRMRRALDALRPGASYFTAGAVSRGMRRAVAALAGMPDTAIMADLSVRDALGDARAPVIFNAHNAEGVLLDRRAAYEPQPQRALVRFEALRTRRLEADFLRRACVVAACSDEDRNELARLEPRARERIVVVPNGVDAARYAGVAAAIPSGRTILVTGSFDWRPNVVGLEWFVERVVPELRLRLGDAFDVRVAGRMSEALATSLGAREGIVAVAHPPDMRTELERARVVLAPVLASSGTRLRVLEAWAAGRPVITTPAGALGLAYEEGRDLVTAEGAAELAEQTARVLDDESLWARLRAGGLDRAREYDWAGIGERFLAEALPLVAARLRER